MQKTSLWSVIVLGTAVMAHPVLAKSVYEQETRVIQKEHAPVDENGVLPPKTIVTTQTPINPEMQELHRFPVTVEQSWVASMGNAQTETAVFMLLKNKGQTDKTIVNVASSLGKASIHSMNIDNQGVMEMRELSALRIPAGGMAIFEPKGQHIMLTGLTAPLQEGDRIELTFRFDTGEEMKIPVPVLSRVQGLSMDTHPQEHRH